MLIEKEMYINDRRMGETLQDETSMLIYKETSIHYMIYYIQIL